MTCFDQVGANKSIVYYEVMNYLLNSFEFSSSEPDVDATLDKLFDEMAFKQNDSKLAANVFAK